jgi:hypothetical protein
VKNLVKDLGVTAGGRFGFVVKPPSCLCEGGVGGFGFCGIASSDDALTCTSSGSIVPGVAAIVARLASYEDSIDRVSLYGAGKGEVADRGRDTRRGGALYSVLISTARWTGRDRDPCNAVSC